MPELPDIAIYIEALERRIVGQLIRKIRLASPFFLRSADVPIAAAEGKAVVGLQRIGKRIVIALEGDLFLVFHLMIAGRLHWKEPGARIPAWVGLAALDFDPGTLVVTEASSKKRASLHVVGGEQSLEQFDSGGLEVLDAPLEAFRERLLSQNHTLKRALADPHLFSGIGNAYSDEILHRARMSPLRLTRQITESEIERLHGAVRQTLLDWTARLRAETDGGFPEKVTAFRKDMAVHGRFRQPCPDCGTPVQRIVYAENEANYCPRCQTGGKLLADRALSRLLRTDWPRTIDELEQSQRSASGG
jgi:formamidopyrimidine-DNA glycosylase